MLFKRNVMRKKKKNPGQGRSPTFFFQFLESEITNYYWWFWLFFSTTLERLWCILSTFRKALPRNCGNGSIGEVPDF